MVKKTERKKERNIKKYLKETKPYFIIIISLFILSFLIGFLFPVFFQEQVFELIKNLANQTEDYNFIQMLFFIWQNNIWSSFSTILFGIFLGIFPVFSTILNGYVLGFVANLSVANFGFLTLLRLLPHGIFEISAIIISISLGLKIGTQLITAKKRKSVFLSNLNNSLWIFIYIILPLLVLAGIIETLLIFFT